MELQQVKCGMINALYMRIFDENERMGLTRLSTSICLPTFFINSDI